MVLAKHQRHIDGRLGEDKSTRRMRLSSVAMSLARLG
jgi:hypothetical protein